MSLAVEKGQCMALLGRNGVGKTTLLKCLMGVLPVARGKVTVLHEGSVLAEGRMDQVQADERVIDVYLGR